MDKSNKVNLYFHSLNDISLEAIKTLSKWSGSTLILHLTSITTELAKELAKTDAEYLQLYGLTSITPEIAKELSGFKG